MGEITQEPCCGNCRHFLYEDIYGDAICEQSNCIVQCDGRCDKHEPKTTENITASITPELLESNGWQLSNRCYPKGAHPDYAYLQKDGWYAQFKFGRNTLDIWTNYDALLDGDTYSDVSVRVCLTAEKLSMAFSLAGIDYKLNLI